MDSCHTHTYLISSLLSEGKQAVLSRQWEYKMAAKNAKQSGQIDQAKQHYFIAKVPQPIMVFVYSTSHFVKVYSWCVRLGSKSRVNHLFAEAGCAGGGTRQGGTSRPELASSPSST